MSENIKILIETIDDIRCDIEEFKIKREFDRVNGLEKSFQIAKDNLVDAVREEYRNV